MDGLPAQIGRLWERRAELTEASAEARTTIHAAIDLLDAGAVRVAEVVDDEVVVHQWLKQAILLLFRVSPLEAVEVGPFRYYDKVPVKADHARRGVRAVPGASARWGSHLEPGVVLMPSYVNIGAYVGADTMVDTWATVGSCAQIGRNVHLSGGVGIGGVLEPPQAAPVIIGDEAMIGSRCMVTQGARVGEGAVLGEGALLNPTIPVIDAETGAELSRGFLPPWTVGVQATRPRRFAGGTFGLPCVLVIAHLEPGQRHDKAGLNDLLRASGWESAAPPAPPTNTR